MKMVRELQQDLSESQKIFVDKEYECNVYKDEYFNLISKFNLHKNQ
jgi:hypothetical protein